MEIKLLRLLERKPDATAQELAKTLKTTEKRVKAKIGDLTKRGVLLGKRAIIDWEKTGVQNVLALVDVKVSPARDVGFDDIAKRIGKFPEVRFVYLVSGLYDFSIMVEGKTMQDIANFIAEKLAPLDRVQSTITHFVLKKFKEAGIATYKEEDERLLLSL